MRIESRAEVRRENETRQMNRMFLEIIRSLHRELLDSGYAPVPLLEHMVRAGFLGKKSGRGLRI